MALTDRIEGLGIPGKVAPPENWHITLRFLGTIDGVTHDRFVAGMSSVEDEEAFRIRLTGFGAFPRARKASVVWAGVGDGNEGLGRLNQIAEEAAQSAGLKPEERPYHPHLTFSRVRPPADASHLLEESLDLTWRCDRVIVYQSRLGGGPARYEPLETFSLSG